MKRLFAWLAIALIAASAVHAAIILTAPGRLMGAAWERIAGLRSPNAWVHAPMVTEETRTVVRPSPDLAYSACAYDLSGGPVRVTVAPWDDYYSVSGFASNSDNFFVANDRTNPGGVDIILVGPNQAFSERGAAVMKSPTMRGVVLQRRLAPSEERFRAAAAARTDDLCAPLEAAR